MSRIANFDATTDFYELNCDNCKQENSLTDQLVSTASRFTITLEQALDLSPLIYLRSVDAEMTLTNFHFNGLPLTFSTTEHIEALLTFPPEIANCNQELHKDTLKERNKLPLKLYMSDCIAHTPKEAVALVNDLLAFNVNFFLLARYLEIFLDKKVLNDLPEAPLSNEDCKLLYSYVNAAMYTRHQQHAMLCAYMQTTDNIATKSKFLGKGDILKAEEETKILEASKCIIPIAERTEFTKAKTISMTSFYGKNVSKPTENRDTLNAAIGTKVTKWLTDAHLVLNPVDEESMTSLAKMVTANKQAIEIGLVIVELLKLEKERADKRVKQSSRLFQSEFLFLDMDLSNQKVNFFFQSDGYVPVNASLTIFFPKKMSYALGSDINHLARVGPITSIPKTRGPRLANRIEFPSQKLPNAVRNLPTLLYLCCDLTTGKGQDTFLSSTEFSQFHIMHTYLFDDTTLKSRAIVATDLNSNYAKIKQTFKFLEQFEVCLLDENFQLVSFSPRTFTRLSFQIRPYGLS